MGHPAHQLSHGRELLSLLELRLRPALLRDVAHEHQHLGDAAALAHGSEQDVAGPVAGVGPLKRDLEATELTIERRGQILARNAGGCSFEPPKRGSFSAAFPGVARKRVDEDTAGRVLVEHATVPVHHGDGIGDRFHEQAEIALCGRRRAQ